MSAHLVLTEARISCRMDFSDREIPRKTTVLWLALWGFVKMSAGLQTPDDFLDNEKTISDYAKDLAADESTHNSTVESIPKSIAKDWNPNPSAAALTKA